MMDPPVTVDDTSLLRQEPLRNYLAVYEACGNRSESEKALVNFVKAMQQDQQAILACRTWVHLLFELTGPVATSFEVTDNGEALYEAFFHYQLMLFRGIKEMNFEDAYKFGISTYRRGLRAIQLRNLNSNAQSTGGRSRPRRASSPKKNHRRSKFSDERLQREGDEQPSLAPQIDAGRSVSETAKPSKGKRGRKRKVISQTPPIITPEDDSGEKDKELFRTRGATAESSVFHRSKRSLSNPPVQPRKCRKQPVQKTMAYKLRTRRENSSPSQSSPASSSIGFGDSVSHPNSQRAGLPLIRRKPRHSNALKYQSLAGMNLGRPRKIKPASAPANKRPRSSKETLDSYPPWTGFKHNLLEKFSCKHINRSSAITGPSLIQAKLAKSKARRKRARLEREGSPENTSVVPRELLGPDIRTERPLPRKLFSNGSAPDKDTVDRGVPCGTPPLPSSELVDLLLRDMAGNALAALQEDAVKLDMLDWTQDQDQEAEDDDLDEHEQDEMDDAQAIAATSVPQAPKPPLPAPPRIWAQSRQEVCESFEHFRSYHSGVYSKDDIVRGYLLGAYAASRDIFHHNGKLIISHGGGKWESVLDPRRGPKRYQMDQDQQATDKSVRALLKTCRDKRPLVLLADDKYALFPYDLTSVNHTYVVLGLYWISHAWAECQPTRDGSRRIVRWKFAFQWCEGQDDPWWEPQGANDIGPEPPISNVCLTKDSESSGTEERETIECESCQEKSPLVYKEGWMCLNPHCDVFWTLAGGEEPKQLDYRETFLRLLPQKFERLQNIIPSMVSETRNGVTTSFAFSKGWHCIECGRLSCRYKWEHWECSNCGSVREVRGRIRSPKEFWHQRPHKEFLHSRIGKDSAIYACRLEPIDLGAHKGFTNRLTFILPCDRGRIHLILGTPLSNGDADEIFELYQQQASTGELKLRRYPLRNHRARGQLLTNYFSQNSGEPYQYVGGTGNTVPFDEAPDCVRRALEVIKERTRLALRTDVPFNEILTAAYMERQKMSFHSDSEKDLGPIVASLSLGSAALMHFRPHLNVDNVVKGKGAYALSLALRHGDVLIMEGDGVQKYYEHTVVPMNFRIAATARCIGST